MKNGEKNQFLLYFFFCMVVFNLAKSISGLLLEKKLVTKREKKVRCASAGIKVIFVFSLLLFILRIKTMICVIMIFDPVIAVTLADSCDGPCNWCLLPRVSISDIVLGRKLSHQWLTLSAESSIVSINTSIHSTYSTVGHYISGK